MTSASSNVTACASSPMAAMLRRCRSPPPSARTTSSLTYLRCRTGFGLGSRAPQGASPNAAAAARSAASPPHAGPPTAEQRKTSTALPETAPARPTAKSSSSGANAGAAMRRALRRPRRSLRLKRRGASRAEPTKEGRGGVGKLSGCGLR